MLLLSITEVVSRLEQTGVVPVVAHIDDAAQADHLARALLSSGITCVEITLRTPAAIESIQHISAALPQMLVGAGTVLTTQQTEQAWQAGARFIVAPGFSPKTVQFCQEGGMPIIPGVATATEIETALAHGITHVKFFPAEPAGGVATLKALSEPYQMMRFMPTGGISAANLAAYLQLKAVFACGGSWFTKAELIRQGQFAAIEKLAAEARALAAQARGPQ